MPYMTACSAFDPPTHYSITQQECYNYSAVRLMKYVQSDVNKRT